MKKKAIRPVRVSLATFVTAALLLGSLQVFGAESPKRFTDLKPDHWAYDNIMKMAEENILDGYPDGTFRPGDSVTCAEFIKMAVTAAELGQSHNAGGKHWAIGYYNSGLNNFLFSEYDIPQKLLDRPISRAHMALIASGIFKYEEDKGDYSRILMEISDVDHRTQYEYHVVRAYGLGILAGYPDGEFRPFGVLSRAEAAAVVQRIKARMEAQDPKEAEMKESKEVENGTNPQEGSWDEPLIITETYDPSAPEGTFMARMRNLDGNLSAEKNQLESILIREFPQEGPAIFQAFVTFTGMDSGGKTLGICKQYVMGYPVLINLLGEGYEIMVFPKDYEDEYWETRPGQVNVYFI